MKPLLRHARPWFAGLSVLIIWQLSCRFFHLPEFILPTPTRIMEASWEFRDVIAVNASLTLFTTLFGFAIAIVVGVLLGLAVGSSESVYQSAYPLLIGFNAIPKVAVVPLIIMWTGIGAVPAVITAFIISFFPIVVNVATGLASVEPEMRDVLRVLGASRIDVLKKVGLPRSLPYFFAALKVAIPLAFIGSVVSETIASNYGIGFLMLSASSRFQVPLVFASLITVAVMSIAMFAICVQVERRFAGWAFRSVQS